jgi:hypothetical protein
MRSRLPVAARTALAMAGPIGEKLPAGSTGGIWRNYHDFPQSRSDSLFSRELDATQTTHKTSWRRTEHSNSRRLEQNALTALPRWLGALQYAFHQSLQCNVSVALRPKTGL